MRDKKAERGAGPGTTSVHGDERGQFEGPIVPPVHLSSTFVARTTADFDDAYEGRSDAYIYGRYGNPTVDAAARKVALLEGTTRALLTASGMNAITTTLLTFAKAGGRIVSVPDVYGGTARFYRDVCPRFNVRVDTFPTTDVKALEAQLEEGAADVVYLESPTNPTLRLVDVAHAARVAREHGVPTVIDNTFATPVNQRPHDLGVDVVVHSATKALNGHSDILAGAVAADEDHFKRILHLHKILGGTLDAHAAFLLDRGIRTLPLRVKQMNANARALAEFLEGQDGVANVRYPGLPSHPQHDLATKQMTGYGSVLSFDLPSKEAAFAFADNVQIVKNAASLGGVETLVSLPIVQSHRDVPPEDLAASGISEGTVRVACGVEDAEDLVADVADAVAQALGA